MGSFDGDDGGTPFEVAVHTRWGAQRLRKATTEKEHNGQSVGLCRNRRHPILIARRVETVFVEAFGVYALAVLAWLTRSARRPRFDLLSVHRRLPGVNVPPQLIPRPSVKVRFE